MTASIRLDSPTYYAYQRLGMQLELGIAPGWHIYGPRTPDGYTALTIEVTSEPTGARVASFTWPPTRPFQVAGLDEEFAIYDGTLRIDVPVEFVIQRGSGDARLDVRVTFQACSATECFPPGSLAMSLTIPEAPTL